MTYNVFGGMLNLALSIYLSIMCSYYICLYCVSSERPQIKEWRNGVVVPSCAGSAGRCFFKRFILFHF